MVMAEGTNRNDNHHSHNRRLTFGALLNSPDDSSLSSNPTAQRGDSSSSATSPTDTTATPARFSNSSSSPRNSYDSSYNQTPGSSGNVSPTPSYYSSPGYNNQLSPYSHPSPYTRSPWIPFTNISTTTNTGLIGSIVREEGHVYSLAAAGGILYCGSDSKNIRVWKNMKDFSEFKSGSGLVKAIVIYKGSIFTGHQDGKIRVWRSTTTSFSTPPDHVVSYNRAGSLPTFKETIKASVNPKNYVKVRRKKTALLIKHYDAVSCMSLNEELGLLYSGSWDKTVKVWSVKKEYKFLETIPAHDDAVNSVVSGFDSLVFTGSADGVVKVWRRELDGRVTRHVEIQTLIKQDHAVTSLAVDKDAGVVYCGASDGVVNFWERDNWHLSYGGALRAHKMAVLCLAYAPGGLIVSGSADRSVSVWRRDADGTHSWVSELTGHGGPIKCLAVEKEVAEEEGQGQWIVYSGSLDRSVKVWRVTGDATESPPRASSFSYYSSPAQDDGKDQSGSRLMEGETLGKRVQ